MRSHIKRRALVVNGTLGVLLTAGVGLAYVSLGDDGGGTAPATRTVTVARGDLTSSVSASGAVESAKTRSVNFSGSGTVDKVYVSVGDKVKKGQKLARLDQTEALENLNAAQASLSAASGGDTSSAQGYASYVQARNAYRSADRAYDATVLYAPFAGTVTAVNGQVGGNASTSADAESSGFVELADTAKLKVDGSFTEADTTKLKLGQSATVTFDALSGVTATGKVTAIDSSPTTTNNVVTFGVTVTLTSRPSQVRIGQTSTVAVTVSKAEGVLYVPAAAVRTAGGQSTVSVLQNGVAATKAVTVGITGDLGTEIKEGLNEGDQVQISATTGTSTSTNNQRQFGGGPMGGGFGGAPPGGGR